MKKIRASWDIPANVTSFNVYHSEPGKRPIFVSSTDKNVLLIDADQLGYVDGDTVEITVVGINSNGDGQRKSLQVTLPFGAKFPGEINNLVLTLV